MAVYQLLGRSTYGPQVAMGRNVSPLWQFFLSPPAQNSVLIYKNGDVTEKSTFSNKEINDTSVFLFIPGGTDFRCTDTSFAYETLTAMGYTWRLVVDQDTYGADYADNYNREWEQANLRLIEERTAAQIDWSVEYARQQRIIELQAELAALLSEG